MNGKKISRVFIAAAVLAFVFSLVIPCAAEYDFGSPEDFEDYGFYGTYGVDDFNNNEEFPFEDTSGIPDRGNLSYNCTKPRLVDDADLLTPQEEKTVLRLLNKKSEELQFDFVVVLIDDLEGKDIIDFAQDYYDYNGYGYGENRDGVLMVADMADRDTAVTSTGLGEFAISEAAGVDYVIDSYIDYLSSENYVTAIEKFVESGAHLFESYMNGNEFDRFEDEEGNYYYGYYDDAEDYFNSYNDNIAFSGFGYFLPLIISLVVGLIIASVVVNTMKSKLKTVRKQPSASNYVVGGSMHIDRHEDRFLYANVAKVKIAEENNNHSSGGSFHGSGGGSHIGSSGVSHSSGSRHF